MQENEKKYISYDGIIEKCKAIGLDMTWRKLNYYKSLGLLPRSTRRHGDRKGYYAEDMVTYVLPVYHFLQNYLGLTLDEIKELVYKFKVSVVYKENRSKYFSTWVELTYGYFLKNALAIVDDGKTVLGVTDLMTVNWYYKRKLNGFSGKMLIGVKEKGEKLQSIEEHAKTWAQDVLIDFKRFVGKK